MVIERVIFFLYLMMLVCIGTYHRRRASTLEGYLLGGRNIGPAVTALTMQSTSMSGYMFMGGPAFGYQVGWHSLWYAVGDAGGGIVNLSILGRRMRRLSEILGCLSPIEYLEKRYESPAIRVIGSFIAIVFLSAYVFAQFISAGKAFSSLFGLSYAVSLIVAVTAILIYTTTSGYLAVVWNDFIQGIIMVVSMTVILIMSLIKLGGLTGLNTALSEIDPTYLSIWGKGLQYQNQWGMIIGAILIYAIGYMGLPHVVVRHMSMKSSETAKDALVYATIWNQFFVYAPYILGLIGIVMLPNLNDPEMVIPELAFTFLPRAAAAIVLCAIMAAVITTADSLLMQAGSILSRDVYQRFINPNANEKQLVLASRLLVLAVGVVGVIVALFQPPAVFSLVVFAFGVLGNSFMVPYIAAVYWEDANKIGALGSMIGGGLTNFIWTLANLESPTGIHPYLAGLLVSIACFFIFNRFGSRPSAEIVDAVRKAQGTAKIKIPKGIQATSSKILVPEAKAVAEFIVSRNCKSYDQVRIKLSF
ncbi:Osmoregulated proline transporter OpuE [Koleobacter methoxysyntrophicus]|uniref:Sodium/proline symporter n=1 Tax=Koleobacter methoxysyntrophicus TaxID=2751313 RepID=A0A8A0RPY3_9FIRM|nr:sodium/proline symporter [Koleobacter methoxysyntrophicus]QSQ09266.1 Osmoregulated proline transporter OpuE [Koleobacter methoxysyntrophicus]